MIEAGTHNLKRWILLWLNELDHFITHICGLGRSSIYKFMGDGRFLKSVSLGDRAVAWVESEVEQ